MKNKKLSINCYPVYKDSGVEWLGKVPEHWALNRHKDNFTFVNKRCSDTTLVKVGLENIESKTGQFISTESEFDGDGIEFEEDDILLGKLRPYLAKVYLAKFKGNAVGDIFVYRSKWNTQPEFAYYFMLSSKYIDVINSSTVGAKMPRVSSSFIANLIVVTPPLSEQKAIAHYLDTKTAQIDRKIDLLTQKAALYGNLKQSLINETVTRGLDKSVLVKDSGIEWLGEIPEHWEVSRIKNLGILSRGVDLPRDDFFEGYFPVYGSNGIIGYHSKYTTKAPCLTVGRSGSVGEVNYVSENFWAHNTALYLQKSFNNNVKFIFYLFKSLNLQSFSAGSAVGTLNRNIIHQLKIAIPPLTEQKAIAHYLDTKTAQIDQIIQTISAQIEKLRELRKTLINDVVTGKIKVIDDF